MTDKDMLKLCLSAFAALKKDAVACRKLLRTELKLVADPYAGSGQYILASEMTERLRSYLNLENPQ